ncbi:proteasome beta 4 subunit [Capsaspora owczarzaki ATCC 30864]|nr:proteasome beta 4 subunit [Capsaspora owczarzaki ATCC 30864]|eukprot:XP_004364286.1 proteasome beta 4 subunit [Capsaspora owczarzaki ATCC 30864]
MSGTGLSFERNTFMPAMAMNLNRPSSASAAASNAMRPLSAPATDGPTRHTSNPIVTGTSVLAIKYAGGVVVAADTCGSYGSLAKFRNISRMNTVGSKTLLAMSGDYADYQYVKKTLDDLVIEDECVNDGHQLSSSSIFSYLSRVMYNRRSKIDPLWNTFVVAGSSNGQPFLGTVDKVGVAYTENHIATGYGAYMALPLMRDAYAANPNMTLEQAQTVINECLKVMYYRDARSWNQYEMAVITNDGVSISQPYTLPTDWSIATMFQGYE